MRVCVSPISGGSFPVQLAMMQDIYNCGYNHDLYFCTSGGAVATFTLIAGNFTVNGINRVSEGIDERYIFKHWSYIPLIPPWLSGFTHGTTFQISPYCVSNLSKFASDSVSRTKEVWIGTFCIETGKPTLFCSKSPTTTQIKPRTTDYDCEYLDGDINNMIRSVVSSSTIPFLMPATEINGKHYVDGGLRAPSPLSFLGDSLEGSYHIDYLGTSDLTKPLGDYNNGHLMEIMISTLRETTRSLSIADSQCAIKLVAGQLEEPKLEGSVSEELITHIMACRDSYYRSCLMLYQDPYREVSLLDLTSGKVRDLIKESRSNYKFKLWLK